MDSNAISYIKYIVSLQALLCFFSASARILWLSIQIWLFIPVAQFRYSSIFGIRCIHGCSNGETNKIDFWAVYRLYALNTMLYVDTLRNAHHDYNCGSQTVRDAKHIVECMARECISNEKGLEVENINWIAQHASMRMVNRKCYSVQPSKFDFFSSLHWLEWPNRH